jgi:hypothetical protein
VSDGRRRALLAAAAAVLVAVAVVGVALVVSRESSSPHPGARPPAAGRPGAMPLVPAQGVYFGAWVKPATFTQAGYLSAVDQLQQRIGRRLDIVHIYLKPAATFPTASDLAFIRQGSTLLVSWALSDTRGILAGRYDSLIRERAQEIRAIGKPVFLEWRWEMDRPNLRAEVGSPAGYIAAWKHIRRIFVQQHADNAVWVWCPTAKGFTGGYAPAYYPGNSQVDWICADAYPGWGQQRSFATIIQPFLNWAAQHAKPIMIGEYGVPVSYGDNGRARWLRSAAQTVLSHPQIKALVYFDSNGTGLAPQTSFVLDASALQAFRAIADARYFNPRGVPVARH